MSEERPEVRVDPETTGPMDPVELEDAEPDEGEVGAPAADVGERGKRRRDRFAWYSSLPRGGRVVLWVAFAAWLALGGWMLSSLRERPDGPDGGRDATGVNADLLLLVIQGGPEELPAMALVSAGPDRADVLLLPSGTVVEVPGIGPRSLAGALEEVGTEALVTSVANALGIRVPNHAVGGHVEVAATVDALGGVTVDVPEEIEVEEDGKLRVLYRAGKREMVGDAFARFLTLQPPDKRELDRLGHQGAAWRALFAALRSSEAEDALGGWSADVETHVATSFLMQAALHEHLTFQTMPVRRVGITGADLYEIVEEELEPVHLALAGVRTVIDDEGRRVRLLVGAEGPVATPVTRLLVEAGYVVVLTGRAGQPYDETRVVIAEGTDELRATAQDLLGIMGVGRAGVFARPQTVFDVTVVIGRDWAEAHGFPQPEPAPE